MTSTSPLSTEQRIELLAGVDNWHSASFADPPVPALRFTDGPAGARGTSFTGPPSASFPCGTALAATFDPELVERIGRALADQMRSKNAHVLLAPTVNLHRHPLSGRNFECYSEDPILAAAIGSAYVRGVRAGGADCCVKHFVGNECELERLRVSSDVDERTLRELYLVPFEAIVVDAGVGSVMTGYNRLNGTYCSEHDWLLGDVLRRDWSFDGAVVSDWGGTHSTVEALRAGLDLEMPGPTRQRGPRLADAVADGRLDPADLVTPSDRIVAMAQRLATVGQATDESTEDSPAMRALLRETVARSVVLLRNRGALPLTGRPSVALIGPYARTLRLQGGGSAQVRPIASITFEEALAARGLDVRHEPGCDIAKLLAPLEGELTVEMSTAAGVTSTTTLDSATLIWHDPPGDGIDDLDYDLRITGTLTPDVGGPWEVGASSIGAATVRLDGTPVVEVPAGQRGVTYFGFGGPEQRATVELEAGRSYELEIVAPSPGPTEMLRALRVGARPQPRPDALARATVAATDADVAIVVVGTDSDWETEGEDRTTLQLPGAQDELVHAVAAVNRNTIVVVNAGAPVTMPWVDEAAAVLMVWFGGEEMANGLTDVLVGDADAGGRLPTTFPRSLDQCPSAVQQREPDERFPRLAYEEGRCIGYRYAERHGHEPLFPFGAGESYATFETGPARVTGGGAAGGFEIAVDVRNTADRSGRHVLLVFVEGLGDGDDRPARVLAGFGSVELDAGAEAELTIHLDDRALRTWTPSGWSVPADPPRMWIGPHAGALVEI